MAKLTRERVIRHLSRIYMDGLIGEAIIRPDFSCLAKAPEGDFYLSAPALRGAKKRNILPNAVGLPKLDVVAKTLAAFAAAEDDEEMTPEIVSMDSGVDKGDDLLFATNSEVFEDFRQRLTSADLPMDTATSDDSAKAILGIIEKAEAANQYTDISADEAYELLRGLSAVAGDYVQVTAHLKGLYFRVGNMFTKLNTRKFPIGAEIRPDIVFNVRAKHLTAVLRQAEEDTTIRVSFSGQHPAVVGVRLPDDYVYAIGSLEAGVA